MDSSVSSTRTAPAPVSKVAARRPMMELELCLIFSGAGGLLAGVSCCAGEEDKAGVETGSVGSGENSEVGEVRLLARPVELDTQSKVRAKLQSDRPHETVSHKAHKFKL